MSIVEIAAIIAALCSIATIIVAIIFFLAIVKNNQQWFEKILAEHKGDYIRRLSEHKGDYMRQFNDNERYLNELFEKHNDLSTKITTIQSSFSDPSKFVQRDICNVINGEIKEQFIKLSEGYETIKHRLEQVNLDLHVNKTSLDNLTESLAELFREIKELKEIQIQRGM